MKRLGALALLLSAVMVLAPLVAGPLWASSNAHKGGGSGPFTGDVPVGGDGIQEMIVNTADYDEVPGVAVGAGADPNPFPGDWSSTIRSTIRAVPFTNAVDYTHLVSGYNTDGAQKLALDNFASMFQIEYTYDAGGLSGNTNNETYSQILQATTVLVFSAGSGTLHAGDNITYSDGAVCRNLGSDVAMGANARIRVICVGRVDPAVAATITGCAGTCGGQTGTVGAVHDEDAAFRPVYWDYSQAKATSQFALQLQGSQWRVDGNPDGTGAPIWGFYARGSDRTVNVGWGGSAVTTSVLDANEVTIPAFTDTGNWPNLAGGLTFDTTNAATTGGQFVYHDGTARRVLQPTKTQCAQVSNIANGTFNFPYASRVPITITAAGCRDDSNAAPGTPAVLNFETLAAASMTLAPTCVGNATAITWTTTTDADATLASGGGARFVVNNTPTAAALTTVCISFLEPQQ